METRYKFNGPDTEVFLLVSPGSVIPHFTRSPWCVPEASWKFVASLGSDTFKCSKHARNFRTEISVHSDIRSRPDGFPAHFHLLLTASISSKCYSFLFVFSCLSHGHYRRFETYPYHCSWHFSWIFQLKVIWWKFQELQWNLTKSPTKSKTSQRISWNFTHPQGSSLQCHRSWHL